MDLQKLLRISQTAFKIVESIKLFTVQNSQIGPKICFNLGAVMQGVSGFLFAFLPYCEGVALFISLSYLLRFIEGLGTAMAWSSALGILMQVFPNKVR